MRPLSVKQSESVEAGRSSNSGILPDA